MNDFIKASALVLVSMILCLVLSSQSKHFSSLLSILVCSIVGLSALIYLQPVLDFIYELKSLGNWNSELFNILLKATGIGIIMQIVTLLCNDSGNTALGKSINILGTCIILWISLPLFTELIKLVNELLGKI